MNDEDYDAIGEQKRVPADQDLSDEFQIKMAMAEFYEIAGTMTRDNEDDKIKPRNLKVSTNSIVSLSIDIGKSPGSSLQSNSIAFDFQGLITSEFMLQ